MQNASLRLRRHSAPAKASSRTSRPFVAVAVRASASGRQHPSSSRELQAASQPNRRNLLLSTLSVPLLQLATPSGPAQAFTAPPAGYRLLVDKLDGYSFVAPENWIAVTSSGNDIFLRNPRSVEENLFVDITSPSSSRYKTVEDLGSPKDAANRLLDQYLTKEFMSTRLGIARYGEIVSAASRVADDGKTYYDIAIRMTSYGSRNAYAATRAEVLKVGAAGVQGGVSGLFGLAGGRAVGWGCGGDGALPGSWSQALSLLQLSTLNVN